MKPAFSALLLSAVAWLSACGGASAPASSAPASAAAKPSAAASGVVSLKYGISGTGGATTIFRLMNQQNIWAQEGLKAEMTQFQGDPIAFTALTAGELEFVAAGADAAVALAVKGAPIRIIGVVQNKFEYHLVAAPDIRSPQDLKGKALAVSKIGSNSDFATREVLKRLQVDPNSVTILQVGNSVERMAAIQSGSVKASIMSPDFVPQLVDKGFHDLADMSKMDIQYPFITIGASTALLNGKPDLAQRFLRATYRGIKEFDANPVAAQKILSDQSNETRPEVIQVSWETYRNVFARDLTPNPAVFADLLTVLGTTDAAMKDAKPEQYIDNRPVQQVNGSGLPQQLFGKS